MLDKQAYEELHDGLIALEVFCENIKDAITKMKNIMEDDYLQHGLLPPGFAEDEDDNLPNVIHLHKDEDKEDKDE